MYIRNIRDSNIKLVFVVKMEDDVHTALCIKHNSTCSVPTAEYSFYSVHVTTKGYFFFLWQVLQGEVFFVH